MRIFFRSAFDVFSGYGRDAIDIARFLTRQGVDVIPMPSSLIPPVPRDFSILLEQDPRGRYDAVLTFGPPNCIKPWEFEPLSDFYVGWSMFEKLPMVKEDMAGAGWPQGKQTDFWSRPKRGAKGLDLLLVTCQMNVEAFRNIDRNIEIDVLPCGIDPAQWPFLRRNIDRPMTFGMIGMLGGRKDPFTMLEAWREVNDEVPGFDAHLKIHSLMQGGIHPKVVEWLPNCEFTGMPKSVPEVVDWYHSIDVLVTTSRGEGNNKPAMEAMATGATVIASDWRTAGMVGDGHANWLHPQAGFGIKGSMEWHDEALGIADFRCSKEDLKELIVTCWKDRPRVASMGEHASRWIRESLSWDRVTRDLERRLEKALIQRGS